MAGAKNVVQRPGSTVWYARLEVPIDVQPLVKKSQYWKSLRTRDLREARLRALPVLTAWHGEFDEIRRRRQPTPEDLQAGVWAHYEAQLEHDRLERLSFATESEIEAGRATLHADIETGKVAWSGDPLVQLNAVLDLKAQAGASELSRESRSHRLAVIRAHLKLGETALIEWAADDLIHRERLLIEKGSMAYRDLCQRLQRAEIQYLEQAELRDKGDWTGAPKDASVAPADPTMGKKRAPAGETIIELYDQFKADRIGAASADTWNDNRRIVQLFAEFVGENSHVTAITRTAIREWKLKLAEWPMKAEQMTVFKGMSFRKVIEANVTHGKPTIGDFTRNKYLSAVSTFTKWLLQHEYLESDVASGMQLELDKKKKKGRPFTGPQLKTIMSSPLFASCFGDKHEHEAGNVQIRDWRYWMPWIALYSGARLGEIAQLLTKDVRQEHGIWIFHVTEEGDDEKSTKTGGSMRVIPIHSQLITLGFLDYHATIVKGNGTRLFPELQRDTRGYFGSASGFFNDYLRAIGVKVGRNVNFHSFRHTMTDAFRRAGFYDEQFNVLLGHTKATTTGRYGIMPEGILSERVKMIEAVRFNL